MSELRERCKNWLTNEGFYQHGPAYETIISTRDTMTGITDALEAFAKEQRIKGMEAVKDIVKAHVCGALCNCQFFINNQIDAAIKQLKEGG